MLMVLMYDCYNDADDDGNTDYGDDSNSHCDNDNDDDDGETYNQWRMLSWYRRLLTQQVNNHKIWQYWNTLQDP